MRSNLLLKSGVTTTDETANCLCLSLAKNRVGSEQEASRDLFRHFQRVGLAPPFLGHRLRVPN